MNELYKNLFQKLVKSYYDGNFDDTLNSILVNSTNEKEIMSVISSLCGVSIKNDENYIYNLKKAITNYQVNKKVVENIKKCFSNCSNSKTSKCISSCPFNAIIEDPIKGTKHIDENLCLHCGICVDVCDKGNFLDKTEFIPIIDLLKNNKKVIAAVAPAIAGQFGKDVTLDMLRECFIHMGFSDMIEVAFAADMLTIKESVEFDNHVNNPGDILITSCCCPMWVGMLKKVYNELIKDVSPSVSPMIAAGRVLKKLNPDAKIVFIGPCIAKKAEAKEKDLSGAIDYVLTFQELKSIFDTLEISPVNYNGIPSIEYASRGGRLYARTGGVSMAVSEAIEELFPQKHKMFKSIQANGVKECKGMLEKVKNGEIDANFLEGMGCIGGCVGGPKALIPKEDGKLSVDEVAYSSSIKIAPHSDVLNDVFSKIEIGTIEDFTHTGKVSIFERKF